MSTVAIGTLAENIACQFLEKHGLILIEKNFTVFAPNGRKNGEIDLIMRDRDYLVFIEVKMRQKPSHGDPLEMITPQKQSQVIRTAMHYLVRTYQYHNTYSRFDAIGISPNESDQSALQITWIKNAFQVQYR